jgi:hypothetical protein
MTQSFTKEKNMTDSNKKPSHRAFTVKPFKGKDGMEKRRWLEIGSVWPHEDGEGFTVELDALPTDGKIVCRPLKDKTAPASAAEA